MDTVIPDRMLYHDVAEDILTEFHPWIQESAFSADPKLLAAARRYSRNAVFPIWFGTAVTGEAFVGNERREELNRRYHPLSVDMETAAMAHVCYVNQIPFLCVRTITDTEEHQGMEYFEKNCQDASARAAEVVMGILEEMESSG